MTPIPENALPNYDKRTIEDPSAFFRTLFHLRDIKEERAIPAVVKDYDAKTGEVTVLPMAKYTFDTRDGEAEVDRETVKVRALKICQGGYSISLPIFKGDTGWLIAGDRRCGAAIEKNGEIVVRDLTDEELKDKTAKPDDCSILNFENGFFIPFSWSVESIGEEKSLIIRNVSKDEELNLENNHGVYGTYPWSMIEIQRDGMVNAYGGGTKFSIGKEGLYLNDKLTFTHGNGLNTIIGNTEDSVPIAGDVEIVGVDGNVEVKTEIVENSSESGTKKSRMTIKIVGGGGTTVKNATAAAETLDAGSDATASVEWDGESKTLNFSFGIPRGPKGDKGEDGKNGKDGKDGTDGTDGIGIGEVVLKSTVGKKKTYSVMSDEATPRELGTFEVDDGTGIGEVKLESTSGRSNTYSIMSDDVPAVKLGTFTVLDGADGSSGQDGDTILSISSGTPTVSGENTITPVTVEMSKSGAKTFNVVSTNGVSASGSDYIDVGDGTGGTTKGQVKAKVPTNGSKGLVTTDKDQAIAGIKTFEKTIWAKSQGIQIETKTGHNFALRPTGATPAGLSLLLDNSTYGTNVILQADDSGQLTIGSSDKDVVLRRTTTDDEATTSKKIPSLGLVNDKFLRIANLVAGSNITITPDATNPKKLTISATGGATLNHSFSWEGEKKADIAASADIAVDSKTIQGSEGITVSEANRIITISGSGSQVAGYTTPSGTYDYEVTGLEWNTTNHRILIHKVKKTYKNGLLKTRESVTDEYIQFVEETV